ncbi:MAG: glycoside hydrolase [Elusimicrobia bacterium]|nr:glycoside hydrolase [Elusimicrobiota bacterium]
MSNNLSIYTIIHQPQRVKLPAAEIPATVKPASLKKYMFDDEMNKYYLNKIDNECYTPALEQFITLLDKGFKISLGISVSFIQQAELWNKPLMQLLKRFISHQNVELVCVEPYHSFIFYMDIDLFMKRMTWAKGYLEEKFGKKITMTDTTEMFMSNEVYFALQKLGFEGAVMDGRAWVLQWRSPTYLYHHKDQQMKLVARHLNLSDDVGYRFSNKSWHGYPLKADDYAHWIKEAGGDFVFLGWDFETFGEHHKKDTGIFDFIRHLPDEIKKRNVNMMNPGEIVRKFSKKSNPLEVPEFGSTWAGSGGMEFFLGNMAQQAIFRLMHHVVNKAKLTGNKTLLDIAIKLTQSDNLHLIQWAGRYGEEAEVSAYFTPREWWMLGPDKLLIEQQRVYTNFLRYMDRYVRK